MELGFDDDKFKIKSLIFKIKVKSAYRIKIGYIHGISLVLNKLHIREGKWRLGRVGFIYELHKAEHLLSPVKEEWNVKAKIRTKVLQLLNETVLGPFNYFLPKISSKLLEDV